MSAVTKKDLSTMSERIICFNSASDKFVSLSDADARRGRREADAADVVATERKVRRES